jgi:hypothetical protein
MLTDKFRRRSPYRNKLKMFGANLQNQFIIALLLFVFALSIFFLGSRYSSSGDSVPAELLSISIIKEQNLYFDEFTTERQGYGFINQSGRIVSNYPIVPGVLNLPVYFSAYLFGIDVYANRHTLSFITSAIITALSVVFMYLCLLKVCKKNTALLFTIAYTFGTTVWSEASHSLSQHGPSLLFLTIALAMLLREKSNLPQYAGFFLGMAVFNRPTNILIAAPLALYVLKYQRKHFKWFILLVMIPALILCWYSYTHLGSIMAMGQGQGGLGAFQNQFLTGIAGLLLSPNRGLLVFTPIFIFGFAYVVYSLFSKQTKPIFRYFASSVILILCVYARWNMWWGGHSFSYRIITEILPMMIIFTAMSYDKFISKRKSLEAVFIILLFVSVYFHLLGAHYTPCGFNYIPNNIDSNIERLWDIKEGELARCSRNLFTDLKNSIWDLDYQNPSVVLKIMNARNMTST